MHAAGNFVRCQCGTSTEGDAAVRTIPNLFEILTVTNIKFRFLYALWSDSKKKERKKERIISPKTPHIFYRATLYIARYTSQRRPVYLRP